MTSSQETPATTLTDILTFLALLACFGVGGLLDDPRPPSAEDIVPSVADEQARDDDGLSLGSSASRSPTPGAAAATPAASQSAEGWVDIDAHPQPAVQP